MPIATANQPFWCKTKLRLKNLPTDTFSTLFQNDTLTANATITVPNYTAITLASVNNAQTFTGVQTFSSIPVFSTGITVTATAGTSGAGKITLNSTGSVWEFGGTNSKFSEAGAATFATSVTSPTLYGGAAANDDLTLIPTSNGTVATSFIYFGSAGAWGSIAAATGAWTCPISIALGTAGSPTNYVPTALSHYMEDTAQTYQFTPNGSGSTAGAAVAAVIVRIGRTITIRLDTSVDGTAAGTTNQLNCTTALPVWARPAINANCFVVAYNNANNVPGYITITTAGLMNIYLCPIANWTNGTVGWNIIEATYVI